MGTLWRRSGSFEFDADGERAGGAQAFFFRGGTTTPLAVYQDANFTTPHDTPVEASGVGRWPAVYIPFIDTFDEQVKDADGSQLSYYTSIANPDPTFSATPAVSSPNSLQTGQWIFSDVDETKDGFVRANGKSIGNATSGATERAHADCEALFLYRWTKIGNGQAAVSGGRGASAAADWAANKTIALPDMRGAVPGGLDTMGAAAASQFTGVPFSSGNGASPGSVAGLNTHTLTGVQLPATTPAGSVSYAGMFTPAGTNSYAGQFTPAGGITYAGQFTPAGTVTKPTITVTDTRVWQGSKVGSNANVTGATDAILQPNGNNTTITIPISVISGAISAALDSTPAFTGTAASLPAATFAGTAASLPVSTFAGTAAALPAATFSGTSFGNDEAHNNVPRTILGTFYIKL